MVMSLLRSAVGSTLEKNDDKLLAAAMIEDIEQAR